MNPLIPDKFNIDGNLVIRFERESVITLAIAVIVIVVVSLIFYKAVKNL